MRLRSATSALLLVAAPVVASLTLSAEGAENFACGAGGRPNPRTARCDCPTGKVERTVGGTSRCVEKAAPTATTTAPTSTAPPTATGTVTMPTTPPTSTGTVTMPTTPPPPSCPPGKMATAAGCVELCAPDELWNGAACAPRCGRDELWTGARCERTSRPPRAKCPDDQTSDAAGHCCWPGQIWGEESQRCRGIPRCPATHHADGESCKLSACEPGQRRVGDGVHCCWEGQEWSRASRACVGIPECPEAHDLQGDRCVPWRRCDAMHVAIDREHCCFPGQRWGVRDDGTAGCAGAPSCGDGYVARGEECVSEEKADADDARELRSTIWGARMVGIGFGYGYLRSSGDFNAHAFGYAMQYHFANVPILLRGSLSVGVYSRTGKFAAEPPSTGEVDAKNAGSLWEYTVGIAFAPLSLPSAASHGASILNPFIGIDWYGITYKFDSTKSDNGDLLRTPNGHTGALLSFGNTFSFVDDKKTPSGFRGGLALTVSYGIQVLSDAVDHLDSRLTITGMYAAF